MLIPASPISSKTLIGAIDQGTSSSRFLLFSARSGELVTYHQVEIHKVYPNEGWVEQNPHEIYDSVVECIDVVVNQKLPGIGLSVKDILCVGVTNQRESTILWDKVTGEPLYNSIVWLDNRTSDLVETLVTRIPGRDINWLKAKTGLPISTYFSALKIKWLIETIPAVKSALAQDRVLFGNVDAWLLWNLTSRTEHLTDVTNASRTLLMDLETLNWDPYLCDFFHIPQSILPRIKSSGDYFGQISTGPLAGVPITGVIGDQNAAIVGQRCLSLGETKVTYGTGAFLMQNIGPGPLHGALKSVPKEARRKLLTTVAYKLGNTPAWYALEGSIAIAGAAITWLRDNLELIHNYQEVEELARQDNSAAGLFFVPAFQGLYAPYWDSNATGTIIGISQFSRKCHLVRATLEGVAYQTNDIIALMRSEDAPNYGVRVDGGMSSNDLLCQILADITGGRILRPKMTESTALGAAMVAGFQWGLWDKFGRGTRRGSVILDPHVDPLTNGLVPNGEVKANGFAHNGSNHNGSFHNGAVHNVSTHNGSIPNGSLSNGSLHNGSIPNGHANGNGIIHKESEEDEDQLDDSGPGFLDQLTSKLHLPFMNHSSGSSSSLSSDDESGSEVAKIQVGLEVIDDAPDQLDIFYPTLEESVRVQRVSRWREAIGRSRKWIRIESQVQKRVEYMRLSALPFIAFVLSSFGMCILAKTAAPR